MTSYLSRGDDVDEPEVVESIVSGKLDRLPPAVPRSVCVFLSSTFSGKFLFLSPAAGTVLTELTGAAQLVPTTRGCDSIYGRG